MWCLRWYGFFHTNVLAFRVISITRLVLNSINSLPHVHSCAKTQGINPKYAVISYFIQLSSVKKESFFRFKLFLRLERKRYWNNTLKKWPIIFAGFWNFPCFSPTCFAWIKAWEISEHCKNSGLEKCFSIFFPIFL